MARIVIHRGKEPIPVKDRRGITVATICICGLSKRHPSCDGSHIKTKEKEQERGKISVYTQDSERVAETPREKPRGNPRHERATNSLGNSIK